MEIKKITEGITGEKAAQIIYDNDSTLAEAMGDILAVFDKGGALFAGVATPATDPGTPQRPVYYLASAPGAYTFFSEDITIEPNELAVLYTKLGAWVKTTVIRINEDWKTVDLVVKSLESLNDIIYGGVLRTKDFATGTLGNGVQIDQTGNAELQYLKVRDGIETPTLVKTNITLQGNEWWVSDYGVILEAVTDAERAIITDSNNDPLLDESGTPLLADIEPLGGILVNFVTNGYYGHTFRVDDILRVTVEQEDNTTVTAWFKVEKVYSTTSIVVTPVGDAPGLMPGLVMARQGNFTDPARQNSVYLSGRDGYVRFLTGVNSTTIGPDNIAIEFALTAFKLPEQVIEGNAIKDATIGQSQLAPGAILTEKIADEAVTGPKIVSGAVSTEQIAEGAITGDKLADGLELPATTKAVTQLAIAKGTNVATTAFVHNVLEYYTKVDYDSTEEREVRGEFWPDFNGNLRQVYIRTFKGNISGLYSDSRLANGLFEARLVRGGVGIENSCIPPGVYASDGLWLWDYWVYGGGLVIGMHGTGFDGLKYNMTFKYTKE